MLETKDNVFFRRLLTKIDAREFQKLNEHIITIVQEQQ
jgi:hypothetical protein